MYLHVSKKYERQSIYTPKASASILIVSDEHIIAGCLRGEVKMQRALYEKYKVPMFRLCLRYAKDRMEAEDMLQEGFIMVFKDLKQFRSTGALGAWMRRLMVNVALQHIRKRKRLFPVVDLENAAEKVSEVENVLSTLNAKVLTMLVQKLPGGYRAVFNMYVIEGYSHKEIAEKLEISVGTSKSQLSKAKAMLRNKINQLNRERSQTA